MHLFAIPSDVLGCLYYALPPVLQKNKLTCMGRILIPLLASVFAYYFIPAKVGIKSCRYAKKALLNQVQCD